MGEGWVLRLGGVRGRAVWGYDFCGPGKFEGSMALIRSGTWDLQEV